MSNDKGRAVIGGVIGGFQSALGITPEQHLRWCLSRISDLEADVEGHKPRWHADAKQIAAQHDALHRLRARNDQVETLLKAADLDHTKLTAELREAAIDRVRLRAGLREACDGLDEARCLDREGECAQAIDAVCTSLRALLGGG